MCDESGEAVSTEVFAGNTHDPQTFASQVRKVAERFGCKEVTFVGNRLTASIAQAGGMIKSVQIKELPEGFHYITAITKPQIKSLLTQGVIQRELFDKEVCEVKDGDVRYIVRRNPYCAEKSSQTRRSKRACAERLLEKKNVYLYEHRGASIDIAREAVEEKIKGLRLGKWLRVIAEDRVLRLEQDDAALEAESLLDGCCVIKTDLPPEVADKQMDMTDTRIWLK